MRSLLVLLLATTHVVPAPTLDQPQFPDFTHDGERLLVSATTPGHAGRHLFTVAEDGGDVRCLTCTSWTGAALSKATAFPDGRRVLVRVGQQSPTRPADHAVVECTPSVRRCDAAAVIPVAAPHGDEPDVAQDQREMRIAPDGVHVAFTQVRESPAGQSEGLGVVGRLVREPARYAVADPRVVSKRGELKGWTPDGQAVLVSEYHGAYEAANPDDVRIDLRTGRRTRVTRYPDWEEDIDIAPDGRTMVVGSARGAHLLEPVAQVRRPAYIDRGLRALPFTLFGTDQAAIAEPWLVDAADRTRGRPLVPGAVAAGWDARTTFRFSPDGTRVTFWQQRIGARTQSRIVVVRLDGRVPQSARPRPVLARRRPNADARTAVALSWRAAPDAVRVAARRRWR